MNRLQYPAGATGISEEIIVEAERLLGREIESSHILSAKALADAMQMSLASAMRVAQERPGLLHFLFGLDPKTQAMGAANAALANPYIAFLKDNPHLVPLLKE